MKTLDQQRRLWRRATAALAIAALAAVAFPVASWAGGPPGPFTDVPGNHVFVDEISEVANAGVAQGYPDGTYRPGTAVTRQAMAAFLSRAGSSVGQIAGVSQLASITSNSYSNARNIQVDIPGDAGTTQYVHVTGTLGLADTSPVGCAPCTLALRLQDVSAGGQTSPERFYNVELTNFSYVYDTLNIDYVFEVPGGAARQFQLQARYAFTSATIDLAVSTSQITATVIPFSSFPAV